MGVPTSQPYQQFTSLQDTQKASTSKKKKVQAKSSLCSNLSFCVISLPHFATNWGGPFGSNCKETHGGAKSIDFQAAEGTDGKNACGSQHRSTIGLSGMARWHPKHHPLRRRRFRKGNMDACSGCRYCQVDAGIAKWNLARHARRFGWADKSAF